MKTLAPCHLDCPTVSWKDLFVYKVAPVLTSVVIVVVNVVVEKEKEEEKE